jgi:hypothetical protein
LPAIVWKDEVPDLSNKGNEGHRDQRRNQSIFDRGNPALIRYHAEYGPSLTLDLVLREWRAAHRDLR